MLVIWYAKAQQLGNGVGAGLMDGRANRHLRRFEIQATGVAPVGKDSLQLKR
jgi:hypothetical protein